MGRRFDPAKWERLLGAERRALLDPGALLDRLGIAPGERVADLGAGPGFFTLPLAERVGPGGRVDAVDLSAEMLERLRERGPPPQVRLVRGEEDRIPLDDASADTALLAFVFHELARPAAYLADARRVLAPGGRLVVLEWVPREEEIGPPLHERVPAAEVRRALGGAGFEVADEGEAGGSAYYLVGMAPDGAGR